MLLHREQELQRLVLLHREQELQRLVLLHREQDLQLLVLLHLEYQQLEVVRHLEQQLEEEQYRVGCLSVR